MKALAFMKGTHMSRRARSRAGLVGMLAVLVLQAALAHGDRLVIRGGGEIEGVILPPEGDRPEIVRVLTATTSRPFEFKKDQVISVERKEDALREYLGRADSLESTPQSEYDLGIWCEQHGLSGPAKNHFRASIELDPEFEPGHKKLGHVLHNGKWMSYDEQRAAQGLIKHKGRWVSPQEKLALEEKAAFNADQEAWFRRLKVIRQKLFSSNPVVREQAESQLVSIREPSAIAPLIKVFGADDEATRVRLAQLIATVAGPEARDALIRLLVTEPVLSVRQATLHELETLHDPDTPAQLIKRLASKDPVIVGRAAWALGSLGAVNAVPKLIPLLVKIEVKWVYEPSIPSQPNMSVGLVEGGPGIAPGGAGGFAVPGASGAVSPGYVGGGPSIPVVTGPVVGEGVVAYGATSIPFGTVTGLNLGGGVNPHRPVMRKVTNVYRNEEVLLALEKLTGVNFGYDIPTWKRWQRESFRPSTTAERRVPQP
jgi:hypothetical protein